VERIISKIIRKISCSESDLLKDECRAKVGMLEGGTSIAVNGGLFLVKAALGFMIGSLSLVADAFHTLSDVLTSLVIFVAFKISKKEPDEGHPFGHGRMESVATLIVAVLLIIAGVEFFHSAVSRILHPKTFNASWIVILVVFATVVVKEALAQFSRGLGRAVNSMALEADFWHHRMDAISSLFVIIALVGQRFGFSRLDGIAGILVAVLVAYTGWDIAKRGIDEILGTRPDPDFVLKIKKAVKEFPNVYDIHDMVIHKYGNKIILSFHIEIPDSLSFKEAHNIADRVEKSINEKFNTFSTIHVDPVNLNDPELILYREHISKLINNRYEGKISFHDVRLVGDGVVKNLLFDIQCAPDLRVKDLKDAVKYFKSELHRNFPRINEIIIEIEPSYAL